MSVPAAASETPAPEVALLRAALRHAVPGASREPLAPLCARVNWAHLLWRGRQLRALPLLAAALENEPPGACPREIAAQLEQFRAANQLLAFMRIREMCQLHDLFAQHDIPVLVASGAALARHHAHPERREVAPESHYFVRRADRARAEAQLARAGYPPASDRRAPAVPQRSRVILHSRLGIGAAATTAPWENAETFSCQDRQIRTFSRAHWLVQVCWMNGQRLWPDFRALHDLAALVSPVAIADWEEILAQTAQLGRAPAVLLGLDLLHRLLGLALPPPLRRALERRPALRRAADARGRALQTNCPQPTRLFAGFRARLVLQPNLAQRARCILHHARLLLIATHPWAGWREKDTTALGIFTPTPPTVVTRMLQLAETTANDVVCDAGCGDGRIVIAAIAEFGARGLGIDLDPQRIAEARDAAEARGISHRARWHCGDFLRTNVSEATVVCLYLEGFAFPEIRRKLTRELPSGARIVSHGFYFSGWAPEKSAIVRTAPDSIAQLYLWRLP